MARRWQPSTSQRLDLVRVQNGGNLPCESCGDPVEPDTGCFHDGHVLCRSDLHDCRECLDAIRDSWPAL